MEDTKPALRSTTFTTKLFFKVLLNTDGAMPLWQVADKQGSFPIPYHSEMETPMN